MSQTATLPTMEDVTIPEVTAKAEQYDKLKNQRLKALGEEIVAKGELIELMKAHGLKVYRDGDMVVEIKEGKEGIKVRHESDGEGE